MYKCVKCGAETKFENGFCRKCYDDNKKHEQNTGLTERDEKYRFDMIKGRIGETLIQELFLSLDFNVFRYGMENVIPGIMDLLHGIRSDVAQNIRRMPDFVVHNPKTNSVYFVEVKFRADGELSMKDIGADYPYTNTYFILVSKKHIKCLTYQELKDGKTITATSHNYLGNRKEFDLNKEVIITFCNFAVKFFECV